MMPSFPIPHSIRHQAVCVPFRSSRMEADEFVSVIKAMKMVISIVNSVYCQGKHAAFSFVYVFLLLLNHNF